MKSLFTVIIILLLPISIYGSREMNVEYDMKQPDGSIKFVKVSVPKDIKSWKIPYLAGKWECTLYWINWENEEKQTHTITGAIKCIRKDMEDIYFTTQIDCTNSPTNPQSPTRKNRLAISLDKNPLTRFSKLKIYLTCKL